MGEIVNFAQYKQELEQNQKLAEKKAALIKEMQKKEARSEADYIFLQILDLSEALSRCLLEFDLFIDGKLD